MNFRIKTTGFAVMLLAGAAVTFSLTQGAVSVSAAAGGNLHAVKECSQYAGAAGEFCTFTSSNLAAIPVGTRVYYTQAAGIVGGLLDSNVILDAGNGNRAFGRCTLDFSTGLGLCAFSDGLGQFAGFQGRFNVSSYFVWDGAYTFRSERQL
jgi:hypothetical protein